MFKVVLACILTIACSSVVDAKSTKLAQAAGSAGGGTTNTSATPADQPSLRDPLPVTPAPSSVSPNTSTTTSTTTSTSVAPANLNTTHLDTSPVIEGPKTDVLGNPLTGSGASLNDLPENGNAAALQAGASVTDVAVTARSLKGCPLTRDHDKGLKYVEITVKNNGQNIAVILGNSAHADVNAQQIPTAPASAAEDSNEPRMNGKAKLAAGVVAAFSFGYAFPIFQENLTPDQHRKRYLGTAIARDGARHEVEENHFGVRVIMPGDESTGWIAFRSPRDQAVKNLHIPISFTRSAIPAGTVTIPVADAATN